MPVKLVSVPRVVPVSSSVITIVAWFIFSREMILKVPLASVRPTSRLEISASIDEAVVLIRQTCHKEK